jgi:hypothetical protein
LTGTSYAVAGPRDGTTPKACFVEAVKRPYGNIDEIDLFRTERVVF